MDRNRIEAGKVARRAFEEEVRRRRLKEAGRAAEAFRDIFRGVSEDQIVEGIRDDREKR